MFLPYLFCTFRYLVCSMLFRLRKYYASIKAKELEEQEELNVSACLSVSDYNQQL